MKFCYANEICDDRGETIQVMVGIVADAQRLNRSRVEFSEIFALVEGAYLEALKELKGSRIFYGRGGWRDVLPEIRKAVFRLFCEWIGERKHSLALSAIDIGPQCAPARQPSRSAPRSVGRGRGARRPSTSEASPDPQEEQGAHGTHIRREQSEGR
jgi:hypothetical protein